MRSSVIGVMQRVSFCGLDHCSADNRYLSSFDKKGCSVFWQSTYHSALNHIFALEGMELSGCIELFVLMRNFEKTSPSQQIHLPWRLSLVLQSLVKEPYELLNPFSTSPEYMLQPQSASLDLRVKKRKKRFYSDCSIDTSFYDIELN